MMQLGKCVVEVVRRFELCKATGTGPEAPEKGAKAEKWRFRAYWLPEHTGAVGVFRARKDGAI